MVIWDENRYLATVYSFATKAEKADVLIAVKEEKLDSFLLRHRVIHTV